MRSSPHRRSAVLAVAMSFLASQAFADVPPPSAAVLTIAPGASAARACLDLTGSDGQPIPLGCASPNDHSFAPANAVPSAASAGALATMRTSSFVTVLRLGYARAGDGPAVLYNASGAPCPLNGGLGDGGAQVRSADGKCWMAVLPAGAADWRIWGADPTGTRDSTAAIQAALNSGASLDVYGAPGTYKACGLVMPSTFGVRLRGAGTATKLVQGACGAPLIAWAQTGIAYTEGTISDLSFDGTLGGADTIDTRGVGGLTLRHLYFGNLPVGYSGILVDGVGSTYNHDDRLDDIQFYSATAGRAVIRFGPHAADSSARAIIGNGEFAVQDGVAIDQGAISIDVSNSHPYNVARSPLYITGCQTCQFADVTLDAGIGDDAYLANVYNTTFTGAYFEAIGPGKCGANLVNSSAVSFINSIFQSNGGSASAVCESGTSDYNTVIGGNIGALTAYANVFAFVGAHSYARNVPGYSPLGIAYSFSGTTTAALAAGTTAFLGVNGAQATSNATAYMAPQTATAQSAVIQTDNTPAAGQSFLFVVYDGGTILGSGTIAAGSYGTTITLNKYVAQYDLIYIKAVFPATAGPANVRYVVNFSG